MAAPGGSLPPDVDITALLQTRSGYLWKLGGGQETGSKWNRRYFVLRDNILMYFQTPKDFNGFRDKPNGVVLLDECNVRLLQDKLTDKAMRPYTFVLSHAGGESVVLAAESEKEMHEWMQAVRTSRMCVADPNAANMMEDARRATADAELDSIKSKSTNPEAELSKLNDELEAVQAEHRQLELEKETAEKQLKELMARFKLRKALLHWRHRKLTLSFRSLVTVVFRTRIEEARRLKEASDKRLGTMEAEMSRASAERQRAEAAKRKSDEMLARELSLKKDHENELKDAQKQLESDTERVNAAQKRVQQLAESGGKEQLGTREKDELLAKLEELHAITAETDQLSLQLKRKNL